MQQLDLLADVPARVAPPPGRHEAACAAGDRAIRLGVDKAQRIDPEFIARAREHILAYLRAHGTSTGELLTDSCKLAGIRSSDDRHFGAVFRRLLGLHQIRWAGEAARSKGHGSRGGSLYQLVR